MKNTVRYILTVFLFVCIYAFDGMQYQILDKMTALFYNNRRDFKISVCAMLFRMT